jgi:hypothetical protein
MACHIKGPEIGLKTSFRWNELISFDLFFFGFSVWKSVKSSLWMWLISLRVITGMNGELS